jgi:hypothetical protein
MKLRCNDRFPPFGNGGFSSFAAWHARVWHEISKHRDWLGNKLAGFAAGFRLL